MGHYDKTKKTESLNYGDNDETEAFEDSSGDATLPQIDRYRILRTLGAGGMGVVFLAEQTEPIRRQVALKLIRSSDQSGHILARFQAEQQTLAQFDHPNVAHVLDAGTAEDGSPYFVMEYVDGESLDEYCVREELNVRKKIEIFLQICDGIQHAHQRGIIHRDIKPSNVLVAQTDNHPNARIIDFGIARAVEGSLVDRTFATQAGQAIGTLAYMSPEQAGAIGSDIDTRTDIYSLGLTLYYMLTGTLPVDPNKLGLSQFLSELSDNSHSLKAPSRAVVEQGALSSDPQDLQRSLIGDLDYILLKAISKSPAQRYQTVHAFASDLRRYLRNEPVLARPPSKLYYFRKFVRRHTVAVTSAAAAVLALVAGLVISLVLLDRTRIAEEMARSEADAANEVVNFLAEMMAGANPYEAGGQTPSIKEVVDEGALRIQEVFDGQSRVKARILGALGDTYSALGEVKNASRLLDQAISLVESSPSDEDLLVSLLETRATLRRKAGNFDGAKADLTWALNLSPKGGILEANWQTMVRNELAVVYDRAGQYREAKELFEKVVAKWRNLQPTDEYRLAVALNGLGAVHKSLGENDKALAAFKESLQLKQRLLPQNDPALATAMANIGMIEFGNGNAERALQLYQEVDRIQRQAFGEQHPTHADTLGNMAQIYEALGDLEAAEQAYTEAIEIVNNIYGSEHVDVGFWRYNLGVFHAKNGRYDEAEGLVREALRIFRNQYGDEHPYVLGGLTSLAEIHANQNEMQSASEYVEQAVVVATAVYGKDSEQTVFLREKLSEYSSH